MKPRVIILSCPQDMHAHAMCEALERKSVEVRFFYTPDFPGKTTLTIKPSNRGAYLESDERSLMEFGESTSVWLRRPYFGRTPEDFDEEDRRMIERECRDMRSSFLDLLCPSGLWVNPLASLFKEHWKPSQLVAAQRCGMKIPTTLVSNDPAEILAFVECAGGPVVYKTFNSFVSTSLVTPDLLSEPDLLRWTPGIYQHYVQKDHELRVTVIGLRVFAVRINSQQTLRGKIDWRDAQWQLRGGSSDLTLEPATLPQRVRQACLRLVRTLGLAYGAIDLIVTTAKEYVFLDVNPSGQFLWIEHEVGLPLLDALAEMLTQGRLDYTWDLRRPALRFDSGLVEAAEKRREKSMNEHVSDLQI